MNAKESINHYIGHFWYGPKGVQVFSGNEGPLVFDTRKCEVCEETALCLVIENDWQATDICWNCATKMYEYALEVQKNIDDGIQDVPQA